MITSSTREPLVQGRVYPPGWINKLTTRIDTLPRPGWIYYLIGWLVLFAIETAIKWRDQAYPVGTFFPFHLIFTGLGIYALALMHYLDGVARRAMDVYRPVLKVGDTEFDLLRYRLTHMPFWPTLLSSIIGAGAGVALAAVNFSSTATLKLATSPLSQVVDGSLFILQWWIWGPLIYHTIRQLRLVNEIYTRFTRLDLFNKGPLYVLSGLAAQTAFGLPLLNFALDATVPETLSHPSGLGLTVFLAIVALITFIWPLWGIHRLLEREKGRLLGETMQRTKTTIAELHQQIDARNLDEIDRVDHALTSLANEQKIISAIPTWPWQPDQVRLLVSSILLPIILWLIQQFLGKIKGS